MTKTRTIKIETQMENDVDLIAELRRALHFTMNAAQEKKDIPFEDFIRISAIKGVSDARLRTGSQNYDLLADIVQAELNELLAKAEKSIN